MAENLSVNVVRDMNVMEKDSVDSMSRVNERASQLSKIKTTPIHVSTITFLCETTASDLDVGMIFSKFTEDPVFASTAKVRGHTLTAKPVGKTINTKGKEKQSFYNQISVYYEDERSKKNIKVFKNGKLHITGEKNVRENVMIADDMCRVLEVIFEKPVGSFKVLNFDIQMINTNFRVETGFILSNFKDVVSKHPDVERVTYEPDTYPGMNMKIRLSSGSQVTALVFNTGNVIITGLRNFPQLAEAYNTFVTFVDDNIDRIKRQNYIPASRS